MQDSLYNLEQVSSLLIQVLTVLLWAIQVTQLLVSKSPGVLLLMLDTSVSMELFHMVETF